MKMMIRKWDTNSHELLETIPEDGRYPFEPLNDESPNVTFFENQETTSFITKDTKCLGMSWDPKKDILHYKTYEKLKEDKQPKLTKRGISATIPSLYDPCGLMMPFITEGKIILQKTWCHRNDNNEGLDWDDPLPAVIREEFEKWLEKLPRVSEISYKRYIFNEANIPMLPEELFLHVFCDAAEAAFGIAAYIRYKYEGTYRSHLIFSSSKMAPSKNKLSIPKKELNAILLGCIKGDYLIKILNIPRKNIILHTDSAVCFHWIQTNYEKLKVYVSNRVQKIQKYDFKIIYVPGELNPADFCDKKDQH